MRSTRLNKTTSFERTPRPMSSLHVHSRAAPYVIKTNRSLDTHRLYTAHGQCKGMGATIAKYTIKPTSTTAARMMENLAVF